jgi:hypothetical protein
MCMEQKNRASPRASFNNLFYSGLGGHLFGRMPKKVSPEFSRGFAEFQECVSKILHNASQRRIFLTYDLLHPLLASPHTVLSSSVRP